VAYKKIGDYGVIGDGRTVALVGRDGAIDWLCLPHLDSPSVFGALLDDDAGGRFAVAPADAYDSAQFYLPRTNVLCTRFRTRRGELELTDFMSAGDGPAPGRLLRRAQVVAGALEVAIECDPRFDYARDPGEVRPLDGTSVLFRGARHSLALASSLPLPWSGRRARCTLASGGTLWLVLEAGDTPPTPVDARALEDSLERTRAFWLEWLDAADTGRYPADGYWRAQLERSALVLKLLQMRDSGAIAAAATTSLPAIVHGERNWDYRFSWIRDASMTVATLFELGHEREATGYLDWLRAVAARGGARRLGIVYRLRAPELPTDETVLPQLAGYKGSKPVRVGQYVVHQRQHDIYGELLDTVFVLSRQTGKVKVEDWNALAPLVEETIGLWREKDDGIWEARIGPQHYVHSKLFCWVALDRAIKVAEHYGFPADLERWRRERAAVRADILARGYDARRGTFVQHYDTGELDAALLLIPLSGFLPIDDPRVVGTIRAIERELLRDGALLRYTAVDGLSGQEGGFMICLFWYVECLIRQGRVDEAEQHLRAVARYANHLGLLGEQYDPRWDEITGNFPQAYSHLAYASVLLKYLDARRPPQQLARLAPWRKLRLLFRREPLNPPVPHARPAAGNPAERLKRSLNVLRGQFYDGHAQRVRYDLMRGSAYYRTFLEAAAALRDFDVAALATDAERVAFWVNLYNTIVIHGVVHLGIADSVREVPRFFDRVCYRIGGFDYTPDDIEHGILRGNAASPWRLRPQLGGGDPRFAFVVARPDPRIHFALVCASKTCPPIEVYDPARLDEQLETSAAVFVNGTTRFDERARTLSVSEIFRWYRADFGGSHAAIVGCIARHLYDGAARRAVSADADRIRLAYTPYDWRLNR